jgi:release factor glutamine methyltransferase
VKPQLVTISDWLNKATADLTKAQIPSARLDAELLLCYMLGVERTWLIAHQSDSLHMTALNHRGGSRRGALLDYGEELLQKRLKRLPIAYIIGHKEFYGRDFIVTKDTLVPRPETEALIELAKQHKLTGSLLDVGTGSGCLGITLALETGSKITLSDISAAALIVAKKNVKVLGAKPVRYVESDLLEHWLNHESSKPFDVIVANLPYVDATWERSVETEHEPSQALFARDGGLEIIFALLKQAPRLLTSNGHLLLEADPEQHPAIIDHAVLSFQLIEQKDYGLLFEKKTIS